MSLATPLLPIRLGQCVLLCQSNLLASKNSDLWLHQLYIRYAPSSSDLEDDGFSSLVKVTSRKRFLEASHVWLSWITFQGNRGDQEGGVGGNCPCTALYVHIAYLHAEDCIVADFEGHRMVLVEGGAASFVGCNFTDNRLTADGSFSGSAVIEAGTQSIFLQTVGEPSEVWLEGCTFTGNSNHARHSNISSPFPELLADNRCPFQSTATFYSDSASQQVCVSSVEAEEEGCETWGASDFGCKNATMLPLSAAGENLTFLTSEDDWLVASKEEAQQFPRGSLEDLDIEPPANPTASPAQTGESTDAAMLQEAQPEKSETRAWVILAGVVAAVAVVALTLVVAFIARSRHRSRLKGDNRSRGQGFAALDAQIASEPELTMSQMRAIVNGTHLDNLVSSQRVLPVDTFTDSYIDSVAEHEHGSGSKPPETPYVDTPEKESVLEATVATGDLDWCRKLQVLESGAKLYQYYRPPSNGAEAVQSSSNDTCAICMTRRSTVGFIHNENMHLCACKECAEEWFERYRSCPVCKVAARIIHVLQSDAMPAPSSIAYMEPPEQNAPKNVKMDFVHYLLDCIGCNTTILGGLQLLGAYGHERLQGGQAIVQIAKDVHNNMEYAIKFFISQEVFEWERGMYSNHSQTQSNTLSRFLPHVRKIEPNSKQEVVDPSGHPLPPCIVMERGESLDIWSARAKPDLSQALSMIHHLALRMKEFHALGYVHRDLKPANIMWLPRENKWTVIDFGCAARTGGVARLAFSIAYAAPEVIAAYRNGATQMVVTGALDAWSLGVVAFELLTGEPAVHMHYGKEQTMNQIEGRNGGQLPWEGSHLSAFKKRRLGIFRLGILRLLDRDPSRRPSMDEFCDICNRILIGSSTVPSVGTYSS